MNDIRCDLGITRFILESSGFRHERTISLEAPITGLSLFVSISFFWLIRASTLVFIGLLYFSFEVDIGCWLDVSGIPSAIIDEEACQFR